jgi:hypothetical protein
MKTPRGASSPPPSPNWPAPGDSPNSKTFCPPSSTTSFGSATSPIPSRSLKSGSTWPTRCSKALSSTHASALTSLTRLQQAGNGHTPAWKAIQRALDGRQNDLLRAAVAAEFLDLVEPAVARATHLRECVVASASSEDADRYLDEATRCYFFALFTACAVMCRSVLEEAIKQKLPESLRKLIRSRYRNAATLGNLLHEVNNNLLATGIAPDFPRLANQVNDIGKKAVHQGLLSEDEARSCLQNAREALQMLLQQ